jgi:hypothetical protein
MWQYRSLALSVMLAGGLATGAAAQSTQPPVLPAPQNNSTIPEKIESDPTCPPGQQPCTTGSTATSGSGETLSDKLRRSDGVIRPPAGISPDMTTRAPVPNPGTTPVIPAPGSPGGNQLIDPK